MQIAVHPERRLSSPGSTATKKIHPLTSIRFFLAFQVMVRHTASYFVPSVNAAPVWTVSGFIWKHVLALSFRASFFFLMSGYVLALVYLRDGQVVNKRRFFAARFARIYPLYLLTLIWDTPNLLAIRVAIAGWPIALSKTAVTFAVHLVMLQAWYPARLMGIDGPNWSLSAEAFFYLCFPVLGGLLWRLRGAGLYITALCLYLCGQAMVWVAEPRVDLRTALFFPPLHLSTFALGVLLARWQTIRRAGRELEAVRAWQAYVVLAASVTVLLSVNQFPVPSREFVFFSTGLLAPAAMGVIWALSSARTLVSQALSARWLGVLGESSYALYLIHYPMFHVFEHLGLASKPAAYPVFLSLCVGLSVLSFYYFETPSRRWLLERFEVRSMESAAMASSAQ